MKKIFKITSFIALFFAIILIAKAEGLDIRGPQTTSISFPIAELGNCNTKQECKTYCDKAENISACAAFAQAHGLISQQEKQQADKLSSALKQGAGPGGCTDAASCSSYCSDASHTDECTAFAQTHNLIPQEKIDSTKKVGQALKQGAGPGGCKNENECKTYCSKAENQQACLAFAQSHGLVKKESVDVITKFNQLVKDGQSPGKCTTKEECQTYCQGQAHKDECAQFLFKLGVINSDAAEKIKQSDGKGPGGCTSKETCDTYCSDQSHQQECINFAKERGLDVKPPQDNKGESDSQTAPRPGDGAMKDCVFKALGLSSGDTLDTSKLTDAQKLLIAKCKPQQGPGDNNQKKLEQQQGYQSGKGTPEMQKCLYDLIGNETFYKTHLINSPQERQTLDNALKKCGYWDYNPGGDHKSPTSTPGGTLPPAHQGDDANNYFPGSKIPKEPLMPLNPGSGAPQPDQQSNQQPPQQPPQQSNQQPPNFPPFPK